MVGGEGFRGRRGGGAPGPPARDLALVPVFAAEVQIYVNPGGLAPLRLSFLVVASPSPEESDDVLLALVDSLESLADEVIVLTYLLNC